MALDYIGEAYLRDGHHLASFVYGKKGIEDIKNRPIIVWGCGIASSLLINKLKAEGIDVKLFCDNDKKIWGEKLFGIQIVSPSDAFEYARNHNGYFILTMTGKNLDIVIRQILIRFGEEWSAFFNCPLGNYFRDERLLMIVIDSVEKIIETNLFRKKMKWYEILRGNKFNDYLYLSIMSTKFWDNFISYIYDKQSAGKILDIGPGFGTSSLIIKKIDDRNCIDWLCYSFSERVEDDYICPQEHLFPVKRIYGEIQNPQFNILQKYDYIFFCEVMEHFKYNPTQTIKKIATWLKEGGILFFSTPTPESDSTRIYESYSDMPEYHKDKDLKKESNYIDQSEEHQYIYSETELRSLFEECGFQIIEYKNIYGHHRFMLRLHI